MATEETQTRAPVLVPSSVRRMQYFFGQLITQADLESEQSYHVLLQRLVQRETFGIGTVAGLRVAPATGEGQSDLAVVVQPGLAIDPGGRELLLENELCVLVAESPEPVTTPSTLNPLDLANDLATQFSYPITDADVAQLLQRSIDCGLLDEGADNAALAEELQLIPIPGELLLEPPTLLKDWLFDQMVGVTYVGIRYREVDSDLAPSVLDGVECAEPSCSPSRTRQGVEIVQRSTPFPSLPNPYAQAKAQLEGAFDHADPNAPTMNCREFLCDALLNAWVGLPPGPGVPTTDVVPLAQVCWRRLFFSGETPIPILSVDNCQVRPLAPGGPALRALIESLTQCIRPSLLVPRLVSINPAPNELGEAPSFQESDTANDFALEATANVDVQVNGDPNQAWRLVHYAPGSGGAVTVYPNGASGPNGKTGNLVLNGRVATLTFSGASTMPVGTYVWELLGVEPAGSNLPIVSVTGDILLDGESNPPTLVPSGNGLAGGTFEARFVVTADPL